MNSRSKVKSLSPKTSSRPRLSMNRPRSAPSKISVYKKTSPKNQKVTPFTLEPVLSTIQNFFVEKPKDFTRLGGISRSFREFTQAKENPYRNKLLIAKAYRQSQERQRQKKMFSFISELGLTPISPSKYKQTRTYRNTYIDNILNYIFRIHGYQMIPLNEVILDTLTSLLNTFDINTNDTQLITNYIQNQQYRRSTLRELLKQLSFETLNNYDTLLVSTLDHILLS